ncbi:Rad4-domain-containing protein [Lentinula edodes]|uniref:Rad4-domain-containing protein n=1 Tax=Lentinula edodes TaxID=5353 RepID=A0A1Q3E1I2_LENED|nr:Rad4-domain-containing protein [Lentinula edodes]
MSDDNDLTLTLHTFNGDEDDSNDEMDWEEVEVPEQAPQEQQPLMQIVLRPDNAAEVPTKKSSAMSHAERMLRIDCHKIHTVLLLLNARIRNQWLNDELLHARLLSLTPLPLQTAFAMIHSSKVPEAALRGRMFESSVSRLAEWWSQDFFEVTDEGHIRNITFDTMKQKLIKFVPGFAEQFEDAVAPPEAERDNSRFRLKYMGKGKEKEKQPPSTTPLIDSSDLDLLEDILDNSIETIKSPKSLMKHALMQSGSRDTSAQLFTALCRALAIPARLVVSLQSVPWKAAIGREAKKYPKKTSHVSKGKVEVVENEGNTAPAVSSPMKGGQGHRRDDQPVDKKGKAKAKEEAKPAVKLRKSKSKGDVLGSAQSTSASNKPKKPKHDDPRITPPTYWTEVFSKADSQWLPVDPIRGFVNKRHVFDPSPSSNSSSSSSSGDNRLVYVLAFEEDGYARDVTRRYAREFGAKVAKVQGGSTTNTNRARVQWGSHTSICKFRGEPVYPRSSVVPLKTPENWLRSEGRSIKEGAAPMKYVKLRASTIGRRREIEMIKEGMKDIQEKTKGANGVIGIHVDELVDEERAGTSGNADTGGEIMQGLYARNQTELYVPDPVVDGIIPKNQFGNIDLYVNTMLPRGAVHMPFKGVAKIARKLQIDFAEAVTGFEFRKRKATPVLEGIVVAIENEEVVLEPNAKLWRRLSSSKKNEC